LWISIVGAAKANGVEYTCYRLTSPPVIDGDLSDWPKLPVLFLGRQDQVASGEWKGPDDLYGSIRLGWNDKGLYFAIDVVDNEVIQNLPDASAETIWSQDAIQWAIDISGTGTTGYDGDDYEYGFGKTSGGPCVYRYHVSSAALVPGKTEQVPLAVKKTNTGVAYEAFVPWEQLIPLRGQSGQKIGFTILIQDADGSGKKTLEWTPGINAGKAPGQFGHLKFSGAAAGEGSGTFFISGQTSLHTDPVKYQVLTDGNMGRLVWRLEDSQKKTVASGTRPTVPFEFTLQPKQLKPGSYTLMVQVENEKSSEPITASMAIERVDVESIGRLMDKNKTQMEELRKLIAAAGKKGIETAYAQATMTVADIFLPFIDEDLKKERKSLALRNTMVLATELDKHLQSLDRQMKNGPDDFLRVPRPDMLKVRVKDGEFMVGDEPVMLVGMTTWMWEIFKDREKFAPLGFNAMRINLEPISFFNDKGEIPADFPWWAVTESVKVFRSMNISTGFTAHLSQIQSTLKKKTPNATMTDLRKEYSSYLNTLVNERVGKDKIFYYTIATEGHRPVPNLEESLVEYRAWLKSEYGTIEQYNRICGMTFTDFAQVDLPAAEGSEKNPARRYDRAAFCSKRAGEELARAGKAVKAADPNAIAGGYISYLMMDDETDFYRHAGGAGLDPELDIAGYDICDGDTAGNFTSDKYAMSTIHWLAMFRDLFAGLGRGKPQFDGEYHFCNDRRAYPDGWVPAIYLQGYIHGLSGTYGWGWIRDNDMDSAVLMDAKIATELSETALTLRRLAKPITAFHKQQPKVAILYSYPSTSAGPAKESSPAFGSHQTQMKTVYEGLFFDGIKQGFISERQVEQGLLDQYKLLIVPAASRVSDKVVEQIQQFAAQGGTVLLVGDCFRYDHRSWPRKMKISGKGVVNLALFSRPEVARTKILPWLEKLDLLPAVKVETKGSTHPVVEWQIARNGGEEFLYLLNMGHKPVTVNLTKSGKPITGVDLITNRSVGPAESLRSLEVRLLKLVNQ
jgi:hypothetical protein